MNKVSNSEYVCPNDSSHKVQSRGTSIFCKTCSKNNGGKGGYFQKELSGRGLRDTEHEFEEKFEISGNNKIVQAGTDELIRNEKDLVRVCKIDLNEWKIDRWTCGVNSAYRKDRSGTYIAKDGRVVQANVVDTGRIVRAPLYNVKVWLVRKTEEIRATSSILELMEEAKKKSIKVPKFKYPKQKDPLILEIDLFDLHFGKLTWAEESGHDYDIKIAREMALTAVSRLLYYARNQEIGTILLPWGNDFFNVDTKAETTTGGTPQQEDTRWKKTFKAGRKLTEEVILMCSEVAPVDVLFIPGNHDEQRVFFLGDAIECSFNNNKNVSVDNGPKSRKYRHYQEILIGFCHGYHEKLDKLPTTMAIEQKVEWANSSIHEWHTGDKHHKAKMELKHEEMHGCTVRMLASLSATDTWHFENQYINNQREATGFLWNPKTGLQAEYHAKGD